jgi:hypothetical protein
MYYYIDPQLPDVAYLSLKTVSDIAPNCAADQFSLGAISRLTPAEHQAALSDATKGTPGSIQAGNYWYGFSLPQTGCMNSAEQAAVQQALPGFSNSEMTKAFNTLTSD